MMNYNGSNTENEPDMYICESTEIDRNIRKALEWFPESSCFCDEVNWRDRHSRETGSEYFAEEYYYLLSISTIAFWKGQGAKGILKSIQIPSFRKVFLPKGGYGFRTVEKDIHE